MNKKLYTQLACLILFLFFVRLIFAMPFKITGPSMCDTLNMFNGTCTENNLDKSEYVIVSPISYYTDAPKRGDIIVAKLINGEKIIKRIIGMPGEKIRLNNDGLVHITNLNGVEAPLDESSYLNTTNNNNTLLPYKGKESVFKIPEGSYFLMGDNRAMSVDSRTCFNQDPNGCTISREEYYIKKDKIIGKAKLVFWPLSTIRSVQ